MFQPFERFNPEYINRLINLNKPYLVAQTYTRGYSHFDHSHPTDILLTDYDDSGLAKTHLNALKGDALACLINLKSPVHVAKLRQLLEEDSGYRLYWAIVKSAQEVKKKIDLKYSDNLRRYLLRNTDWKIGADETVKPSLKVIFGEMYMIVKRGAQHELRVKFAEIEKA